MRGPAHLLVLALLVVPLTGCASVRPDVLQVFNETDGAVSVRVLIEQEGKNVTWMHVAMDGRGPQTFEVGRLSGPHRVQVDHANETHERPVRLERIKEYVQVYVMQDDVRIVVLHGD